MPLSRPILSAISLFLLAGGVLLQFFVFLSGGVNSYPENTIYFLKADTNGIPGARNPSLWTSFAICGIGPNGRNVDCGKSVPALPFDPPHRTNFRTTTGVPPRFVGTNSYFYLSRFAWVFFLIAIVFSVIALFTGLLALCSRLGGYLSGLNTAIALFFQGCGATLMTAWTVRGRNGFKSAGLNANLGVRAFAFTYTAFGCFFISTILFCLSGAARKRDGTTTTTTTRRRGFFNRKGNRARGSFVDANEQQRAKEGYP